MSQKQVHSQGSAEHSNGGIQDDAGIDPIIFWNLNRFEGAEHLPVLDNRGNRCDRAQRDKGKPDPESGIFLQCSAPLGQQHLHKQAEPFNHEPECHQGEAGAIPCQQRAFSSEENSGIIQVGHGICADNRSCRILA